MLQQHQHCDTSQLKRRRMPVESDSDAQGQAHSCWATGRNRQPSRTTCHPDSRHAGKTMPPLTAKFPLAPPYSSRMTHSPWAHQIHFTEVAVSWFWPVQRNSLKPLLCARMSCPPLLTSRSAVIRSHHLTSTVTEGYLRATVSTMVKERSTRQPTLQLYGDQSSGKLCQKVHSLTAARVTSSRGSAGNIKWVQPVPRGNSSHSFLQDPY